MDRVVLIASGPEYQEAAARAAATYVRQTSNPEGVSVLVPESESLISQLKEFARKYGFQIARFPFRQVSQHKFTSQLKCQAFWSAVSQLASDELLLIADADTVCLKPLVWPPEIRSEIMGGRIGLAADIEDHHFQQPSDPWYLTPEERSAYVNSGVILTARSALPMFEKFREMSAQPRFLHGPFNDQKVINFALGKYFRGRLLLLDQAYNGIHRPPETTIIGHCAGGAGCLGSERDWRKAMHQEMCAGVLKRTGE